MKGEKWATLSLFPVADMNANKHVSFGFKGKRRRNYHMFLVCSSAFCLDMFVKDKPDLMNVFFELAIYTSQICMNLRWASSFGHLLGGHEFDTSEKTTPTPDFGLQRQNGFL